MTKAQQAERDDAIAKLREWIKPGDTVYTVLDHVSASGMSRAIRVVLLSCENGKPVDLHPNWAVGKALGLRHYKRHGREQDALVVGGAGMDMGFHLVYNLGSVLFGERADSISGLPDSAGWECTGENCPHNSHVNDRNSPRGAGVMHGNGGYALRHRWL